MSVKATTYNGDGLHFKISADPSVLPRDKGGWDIAIPVEITESGKRKVSVRSISTYELNGENVALIFNLTSEREVVDMLDGKDYGPFQKGEKLTLSHISDMRDKNKNPCKLVSVHVETVNPFGLIGGGTGGGGNP